MAQKIVLLLILLFGVPIAAAFTPRLDIDLAIGPLFPGNQKIYDANLFYRSDDDKTEIAVDTLVRIRDNLKWMAGYTTGSKIGEVTPLNVGVAVQFGHFFNRYSFMLSDEVEGAPDSLPCDVQLFTFQGGIYSALNISNIFKIEPEVCFLLVRSHYSLHLLEIYQVFRYSINKPGVLTGLKLTCIKPEKLNFGVRLIFLSYAEIKDLTIDPFVECSLAKKLQWFAGLKYSILTNAINPTVGLTFSLF